MTQAKHPFAQEYDRLTKAAGMVGRIPTNQRNGLDQSYADRVRQYESEGMCTSDAQAVADVDGGPQS